MKNKKIFKTVFSAFLVAVIIAATIFASSESKGNSASEISGKGALLLLSNVNLETGAFASAQGNGITYYATIIGSNRILFPPNMAAGSYVIYVCTPYTSGSGISGYSYHNNAFQYNGGEQAVRINLTQTGPCNIE